MKYSFQILTKTIGSLLTIAAFIYIGFTLRNQWQRIIDLNLSLPIISIITPGAIIYGISFILIGFAWHHMLRQMHPKVPFRVSYWIFSRSQIGKYLPGNFFHYAGRQWLGRMCNIPHDLLIATSTCEIFFQILTSVAIACIGATFLPTKPGQRLILIIGMLITFFVFVLILYSRYFLIFLKDRIPQLIYLERFRQVGQISFFIVPFLIYCLHLVLIGTLVGYLSHKLSVSVFGFSTVAKYTAIYTISWTFGFVTPGAPGGLGIREALLTAQIAPLAGTANAVMIALCLRLAAVIGDVVLFLTSFIASKSHPG